MKAQNQDLEVTQPRSDSDRVAQDVSYAFPITGDADSEGEGVGHKLITRWPRYPQRCAGAPGEMVLVRCF